MKKNLFKYISIGLTLILRSAFAQGTLVYDQQSSTESNIGEGAPLIQQNQPFGQSFTPTLPSVGFVRLFLADSSFNSVGATVFLNLRSDSITGQILGSTTPVFMPDGFSGFRDFFFTTPVAVNSGLAYYFQPVVQSGDTWQVAAHNAFAYPGGTAFYQGVSTPGIDLWFREGIVVPEPTTWALLLVGFGLLACWHRRKAANWTREMLVKE